jgi:MarR family transcriptional regulator, lower aerobic nicotinate degradation pathway regulator
VKSKTARLVPERTKDLSQTYNLDQQIGFRLRLAMQRHTELFFKNMVFNLTQPQFAALARLYRAGPCSQNHLGRSIALDSASIVGVVSRLKSRKLISASKDKEDRRRIVIDLTAGGRAIIAEAIKKGSLANELTLAPLTSAERKTLIDLLGKIAPSEEISEPDFRPTLAIDRGD